VGFTGSRQFLALFACWVVWLLQVGGVIGALMVVWLTAFSTTVMGWAYRKQATPFVDEPKSIDLKKTAKV